MKIVILNGSPRKQVVELIRKEVKQRGKAAVIVTHDERVTDLADRVLRLEDGSLVTLQDRKAAT